jgi:hypothetical protein
LKIDVEESAIDHRSAGLLGPIGAAVECFQYLIPDDLGDESPSKQDESFLYEGARYGF